MWLVDGTLFVVALVGAYFAWSAQDQAGRFRAMRLELQQRVGEIPISDSSKYHVMLLESENPLEFRWRVYIPSNLDTTLVSGRQSTTGARSHKSFGFSSNIGQAFEGMVWASIEPAEGKGNVRIAIRSRGFNSRGGGSIHWNDAAIQQMAINADTSSWKVAGRNGVESIDADDVIRLLEITSPTNEVGAFRTGSAYIALGTQKALTKMRSP